jgi:hypothetical protein
VCPLQLVKFGLAVRGRCRHVAKRADGIYRLIRIDAVEELVIMHSPTCIIGLHDWIPKPRGCTAFGQTEVTLPQSALQQQIPSHPALLITQPRHSSGPMNRVASVAFSLTLRTTTPRKTLRPPVQNLHATLAAAGMRRSLLRRCGDVQPLPATQPIHIPHTASARKAKIRTTPFGPTSVKIPDPARLGASGIRTRLLTRRNRETL